MATYSSPPGPRMDYTQDGTFVGYWFVPASGPFTNYGQIQVSEYSFSQKTTLNKETVSGSLGQFQSTSTYTVFVFPELRNLSGIYVNQSGDVSDITVEVSSNTTNGVDGTWSAAGTLLASGSFVGGSSDSSYRSSILSLASSGVQGVRFRTALGAVQNSALVRVHLYGTSVLTAARLRLWHPTADVEVPGDYLDWGDTPRGSSEDKVFRIKNTSTSQTASNVTVQYYEPSVAASPSSVYQHYFSDDGLAFRGRITIPSLGPGILAGPYYARRVTPSDAVTTMPLTVKLALEGTWI